jgi:hypothetical protein
MTEIAMRPYNEVAPSNPFTKQVAHAVQAKTIDSMDYGDAGVCVNDCPTKDNLDGRTSTFAGAYGRTTDPFSVAAIVTSPETSASTGSTSS